MNRLNTALGKLVVKANSNNWLRNVSTTNTVFNVPTIKDVRASLMKLVAYDATWGEKPNEKELVQSRIVSKNQQDLPKQRMLDSYSEAIIPLGDAPELRNKYANFQKGVRFGRLLEDLDTMAVHIAYNHCKSQTMEINGHHISPIVIVTGLVDRIQLNDYKMCMNKNIKLSGFTSWVGKSSSEITMKVEQELTVQNEWVTILEAKFLMCARDINNKDAGLMNPLEVVGKKEISLFEQGNINKLRRSEETKTSLSNLAPNAFESLLIHGMFKQTIDLKSGTLKVHLKPENTVWMEETILKNVIICHPEQRNLYNKIFGGFLMRQAFELAWTNATLYSKTTPKIKVVDNITFKRPVLIGSLLLLSSQIVYTDQNHMLIKVLAQSVEPRTNQREITNDFYFKFAVPKDHNLPQVMPKTYSEYMLYIDGMRHLD